MGGRHARHTGRYKRREAGRRKRRETRRSRGTRDDIDRKRGKRERWIEIEIERENSIERERSCPRGMPWQAGREEGGGEERARGEVGRAGKNSPDVSSLRGGRA